MPGSQEEDASHHSANEEIEEGNGKDEVEGEEEAEGHDEIAGMTAAGAFCVAWGPFWFALVLTLCWLWTLRLQFINGGKGHACEIRFSESRQICSHDTQVSPEELDDLNNMIMPRTRHIRWANISNHSAGVLCSPFKVGERSLGGQCCYVFGNYTGDQISAVKGRNSPQEDERAAWATACHLNTRLPLLLLGCLPSLFQWLSKEKMEKQTGKGLKGLQIDEPFYAFDADMFSFNKGSRLSSQKWCERLPDFLHWRNIRAVVLSVFMAVPWASDFLLGHFACAFCLKRMALRQAEQAQQAQVFVVNGEEETLFSKLSELRGLLLVVYFALAFLFRCYILLLALTSSGGDLNSVCDYYISVAMYSSQRAMVVMMGHFYFHGHDIQFGVHQMMHDRIDKIEEIDQNKDVCDILRKNKNYGQTQSLTTMAKLWTFSELGNYRSNWHRFHWLAYTVLALVYAFIGIAVNAEVMRLKNMTKMVELVGLSFASACLILQVHRSLWMMDQSAESHSAFIKTTLGPVKAEANQGPEQENSWHFKELHDIKFTALHPRVSQLERAASTPVPGLVAPQPGRVALAEPFLATHSHDCRFDVSEESDLRIFFLLWDMVNTREMETALIMDSIIITVLIIWFINVLLYATIYIFHFSAIYTKKPIFVYGSEIWMLTGQALGNVIVWGVAMVRALYACWKFDQIISRDADSFVRRCSPEFWLNDGKLTSEQKASRSVMMQDLRQHMIRHAHKVTFLGMPITGSMVARVATSVSITIGAVVWAYCRGAYLQIIPM